MSVLNFICEVLEIEELGRQNLEDHGVASLEDLICIKDKLKDGEFRGLTAREQTKLHHFLTWVESYEEKHGIMPDPVFHSTMAEYQGYINSRPQVEIETSSTVDLIALLLITINTHNHKVDPAMKDFLAVNKESILGSLGYLTEKIKELMPKELTAKCHFDYDEFIRRALEAILLPPEDSMSAPFIADGRTQSGKSAIKALVVLLCHHLKIGLVIVTKGIRESRDLHAKIGSYIENTEAYQHLHIPLRPSQDAALHSALKSGGTVVFGDTGSQLERACAAVREYKSSFKRFVVIVDECDEMYRTPDRSQKMEQAYHQLMDEDPALQIMISATPVPFLIDLKKKGQSIGYYCRIHPSKDYYPLEEMKVLTNDSADRSLDQEYHNRVFLPTKLSRESPGYEDIPYFSMEQALLIEHCLKAKGKGSGVAFKAPDEKLWTDEQETKVKVGSDKMGDVLDFLDNKHSLERPIFIFGYSKMQRGISFRSRRRVPTHIMMGLGGGYSVEAMIQAMGRATFQGKDVLKEENGHEHVTVLTSARDWDTARAYRHYLMEIEKRLDNGGMSLDEAMNGMENPLSYKSDFMHGQSRKIGKHKMFKESFDVDGFEKAPSDDEDLLHYRTAYNALGNKYRKDVVAQLLLQVLIKMHHDSTKQYTTTSAEATLYEFDDIHDAYQDLHRTVITKAALRKKLNEFKADGIVHREDAGRQKTKTDGFTQIWYWRIKNPNSLEKYMLETSTSLSD